MSEAFRSRTHDRLHRPRAAVEGTEAGMRTLDREVVARAPHGAAQDDRRVGDVESVDERFVVFDVNDVDAEERRRDRDSLVVDDDDRRHRPPSRDESGRKWVRHEADFRNDLVRTTSENLKPDQKSEKKSQQKFLRMKSG